MVRKLDLDPSLPVILSGLQRQATQGIGRAASKLVVQTGEPAPEGVSVIPSVDVLQSLSDVDAAVEAAEQELADAQATYDAAIAEHSTAIQAAETAITEAQSELGALDGRITSAVQDAAALSGRVDDAEQAIVDAQADLATAQDAADQALADALAAQSAADTADAKATTADARITIGIANPTATDAVGKPEGAIWEVWSSGKALRRFVLRSGAWVQTGLGPDFVGENAIGDAQVSSLSVGKLSGAVGEFTEAVVGKMTGHSAFLRNLLAQRVVIGSAENLIPNGSGEFGGLGGWTPSAGMTWDASDAPTGLPGSFVRVKGGGTALALMELVPVEPGAEYFYELWMKADVPDSRIYVRFVDQDSNDPGRCYAIPGIESGTASGTSNPTATYAVSNKPVPTEWTRIAGRLVMNATTNAVRLYSIFYNHTNGSERNAEVKLAGLRLMKRATGELIVDGAISARHVEAESVAAAVGVFIDAMMQNLTVTGVANIKQLVADELFAKLAVVDKLQALTSIITQDMIATGAITSEKVAANAISAAMVDVGQNMRFTSDGIEIYAPVVGDQDPTDWAHRDLLIKLTPEGLGQIAIARDGVAVAAMLADGTVMGERGDFNELSVQGQPIGDMLTAGPRGLVSVSSLSADATLQTAETRLLVAAVRMFPNRMYEARVQIFVSSSADVRVRIRQSGSGVPTTANTLQSEMFDETAGRRVLTFSHIISPEWVTETIPEDGLEMNIGVFVMGSAAGDRLYYGPHVAGRPRTMVQVHDIGEYQPVTWQEVASTVAPTTRYSKGFGWASWWRGFTQDGQRHSVDSRATVGGRVYGSDMHEHIMAGVKSMTSTLSGSTVEKATVTVRRASSGGSSSARWRIGFVNSTSAPSTLPSVTYIATNQTFGFGQARTFEIPAAHRDKLRTGAFRQVVVSPEIPNSLDSYGYLDYTATRVDVTYRK